MKKNKIKYILISLFSMFLFVSCEYTTIELTPPELPSEDQEISFAQYIQPIFASKCATCHITRKPILTSAGAYNSLINDGYVNTTTPASSTLYTKVLSGHPGGSQTSTATENALILRWITEGAKNN